MAKLCIQVALALIGLILEVVVFSSPNWAIFKFPINPDGSLKDLGGTLSGREYPPEDSSMNEDQCAELSFGLWKIESCAQFPSDGDDYNQGNYRDHDRKKRGFNWQNKHKWNRKCFGNGYKDRDITYPDTMSDDMKPIKQMIQHVGGLFCI